MSPREATPDRQGMQELTREECLGLMSQEPVGRLVFVDDGQPTALPVNHAVSAGSIVFRTTEGSKLEAVEDAEARVAFECDDWDEQARAGWSVLAKGRLQAVTEPEELERLEQLGLDPWADTVARQDWLRVVADELTGRRVLASEV